MIKKITDKNDLFRRPSNNIANQKHDLMGNLLTHVYNQTSSHLHKFVKRETKKKMRESGALCTLNAINEEREKENAVRDGVKISRE